MSQQSAQQTDLQQPSGPARARVVRVSGPLVVARGLSGAKMHEVVRVGEAELFGEVIEKDGIVESFEEKPQTSKGLINGGYMVFNKNMLDYLTSDENCDFEFGPLEKLADKREVMTYKHKGFWECADTVRDVNHLNKLWESGNAKWKIW